MPVIQFGEAAGKKSHPNSITVLILSPDMVSDFQKNPKKNKSDKDDSEWLRFKKLSNED